MRSASSGPAPLDIPEPAAWRHRSRAPALLAVLAWVSLCLAATLLVAAWIDPTFRNGPLRPERLVVAAACSAVLAKRLARRQGFAILNPLLADASAHRVVGGVALIALVALLAGLAADSVGGADSAGYLAQANRWRAGSPRQPLPLPDLPLTNAAWVQSPLGFRPSADALATVPIYPPGWPVLMAAALTGGPSAAIRGLPVAFAALAVAALFLLALRHATPATAWLAVTALATSAPFLFQALQPMSDVPALALWLAALLLASGRSIVAGTGAASLAAVALAVRPNLTPLLLIVGWMAGYDAARPRNALRRFAGVVAPGLLVLGAIIWLQAANHGDAWQSGYGTAGELFALGHIWPNVSLQFDWLAQALGWPSLVLLAVGVVSLGRRTLVPPPLAAAALIVWLAYLVYQPFDSWTYLRFVLLPLAVLLLAGSAGLESASARLTPPWRLAVVSLAIVLVGATGITASRGIGALDVRRDEARYRLVAEFVSREAPPRAVLLAAQHSGSLAAYTALPVLRLDLLQASDVAPLLQWLEAHHRPVYLVMDQEEQHSLDALRGGDIAIDWPPRARAGSPARALVWSLDDRPAFLAGHPVPTARLLPSRR